MTKQRRNRRLAFSYLRFSTIRQNRGDSRRRQYDGARQLAQAFDWDLDESLTLHDLGVSAYKGRNVSHGALGKFLKAIESGRVPPGSVLIVESLDRLSRQQPLKAIALFAQIIEAGVSIATLIDRTVYECEEVNRNPGLLQYAFGVLCRAFDESNTKSERVSTAWEQKRKHAGRKPLSAKCPAWCRLNKDTEEFEFIEDNKALMLRIVQMGLDGLGSPAVAITLNREGVKPLGRAKKWESSNIRYWWRSRTLIGEYQPCRMVDGRAVPDGDPIPGYYPRLISDEIFYKLQHAVGTRSKNVAGRGARGVANLFGRKLKSGFDGSTMYLSQKRKANVNLISAERNRGLSDMPSFPYPPFEYHFLSWVSEVHIDRLDARGSQLDVLQGRLAEVQAKIGKVDAKLDACSEAGTAFDRLLDRLTLLNSEEQELKASIEQEKAALNRPEVDTAEIGELLKKVKRTEESKDDEQVRMLRTRLRAAIHNAVKEIKLYTYHKKLVRLKKHVFLRLFAAQVGIQLVGVKCKRCIPF